MKLSLRYLVVMLCIACICSCSNKEMVRGAFFQGIYESANLIQEMEYADKPPQPGGEVPAYGQYKLERQEMLTDHESDQPQQTETSQRDIPPHSGFEGPDPRPEIAN